MLFSHLVCYADLVDPLQFLLIKRRCGHAVVDNLLQPHVAPIVVVPVVVMVVVMVMPDLCRSLHTQLTFTLE